MSTLTAGAGAGTELGAVLGPPVPLTTPEAGVGEAAGAVLAAGAASGGVDPGGAPAASEEAASENRSAKTINIGRRMRDFPFPKAGCAPEEHRAGCRFVVRPPARGKAR